MASTVKNTTLDFGLVSLEVALTKAGAKKDVRFDRASADGNPIKRIEVDELTGEQVSPEDVQKGIREGDTFYPISADALEAIESASKEALPTIEVEEFVAVKNVPMERVTGCYYLVPQKGSGSARGMKYLLRALTKTKKAGIAKFLLKSREYLAAIYAQDGRLVLSVLAFADDFAATQKAAAEAIEQGGEVTRKALDLTVELVNGMEGDGSVLAQAKDELVAERARLVGEARQGKAVKPKKGKAAAKPQGDSLEATLEAAVEQVGKRPKVAA